MSTATQRRKHDPVKSHVEVCPVCERPSTGPAMCDIFRAVTKSKFNEDYEKSCRIKSDTLVEHHAEFCIKCKLSKNRCRQKKCNTLKMIIKKDGEWLNPEDFSKEVDRIACKKFRLKSNELAVLPDWWRPARKE